MLRYNGVGPVQHGRLAAADRSREETNMINKGLAAAIALILAMPAIADEATPDHPQGRYTFNKVADGFLRLDTQTGEVSLCSQRAVGWACVLAPEDRTVLENEIARLRSENALLKGDILSRGLPLPAGTMPEPPAAHDNGLTLRLPDSAELDRAIAFVGRMWNRLVEAIANAQKDVLHKS